MSILSLPHELLLNIQSRLAPPDLSRVSRSCSELHKLLTPILYNRDEHDNELGPLQYAASHGSAPPVDRSAKVGLRLPADEFSRLVLLAAFKGYKDCVESLLNFQPFDINSFSNGGSTALAYAVYRDGVSLVKLLLDRGADPNLAERSRLHESPLHIAARLGFDNSIEALLLGGASSNAKNAGDEVPLLKAIQRGRTQRGVDEMDEEPHMTTDTELMKTTRIFLEHGHQMDSSDSTSCLYEACWQGRVALAQLLMSHGANPHHQTDYEYTCLGAAASKGHTDIAKLLIGQRVDANTPSKFGFTPLIEAVRGGHLEIVKLLVEVGSADVNLADRYKDTPLFSSLTPANLDEDTPMYLLDTEPSVPQKTPRFNEDIVRYLVEQGADLHTISPAGSSTLRTAIYYTNYTVVKLVLTQGAAYNDAATILPLIPIASSLGKMDVVKLLLRHDSAARVDGSKLQSVLSAACANGDLECVKMLVNAGADVNVPDQDGETCLQLALEQPQVCQYLIDHGSRLETKLDWGYTALLSAVESGFVDSVALLIAAGADVTACNDSGQNALMLAGQYGHEDIARRLLETGKIDINAQCIDKRTALDYAALRNHLPLVELMLSSLPASALKHRDRYGSTPLIAAARQDNVDIVKRILAVGDVTLLKDRDQFDYTALHWAAMESVATKEFLLAATLDAGLDPNLDHGESSQGGFYGTSCVCDVCGRARTCTEMDNVRECEMCHTGKGDPFIICEWCHEHGKTCRDEQHQTYNHICECGVD